MFNRREDVGIIADKIVAMLVSLSPADIEHLPPVERRRLADCCRHTAEAAEHKQAGPKAGVLVDLRGGRQA
jgi:hypothetical protein